MIWYKQDKMKNQPVTIIYIETDDLHVKLMDYGATLLQASLRVDNQFHDMLVEYESLDSYDHNATIMGATVGPTAGRTKNGVFLIDGKKTSLDQNFMKEENLHGGKDALSFQRFHYNASLTEDGVKVEFEYVDSDSSYPGAQDYTITYTIRKKEIQIDYLGHTTEPTLMNLTNHSYFNLDLPNNIFNQTVQINASKTAKLDEHFVPNELIEIPDTLSSKEERVIGKWIQARANEPECGIDNPFLLDHPSFLIPQAVLKSSKLALEVYTTYPVIVCYTHNHSDGNKLKHFNGHPKHSGICFEAQYMPNGHNVAGVFDTVLRPNEAYKETTLFRFKHI